MRSSFLDIPGGPVQVLDFGGEGRIVVLVHGLGGSAVNWQSLGPLLSQRARVIALDLAGFGRTPLGDRRARVEDNRRLLSAFLDRLAPRKMVTLVGNSMGGLISMLEASAEPERIDGLVLIDPSVPRAKGVAQDPAVVRLFAFYALPWLGERFLRTRAERVGPEGVVRETLALCTVDLDRVAKDVYAAHVELARERHEQMPWSHRAFLDAARSIVWLILRPRAFAARTSHIAAPTLVIQGERDRLVPAGSVAALCRARPDWELELMPGIGHVPMLEAPVAVAERIFRWFDAHPPGAGDQRMTNPASTTR